MKTLKKIYMVAFLIGSMLTSALFVQGQFDERPSMSAGPDATICNDQDFSINGKSTYKTQKTIWKTSGDGVFDNPHSLKTVYTPGQQDIAYGKVTLHLVLLPNNGDVKKQVVFNGNVKNGRIYDSMSLYLDKCSGDKETK